MELAIADVIPPDRLREAIARVAAPERMFAGVLREGRVALYKRSRDHHVADELAGARETLRACAESHAAGVVDLGVSGMSLFCAADLLRVAELALDKMRSAETAGLHRLVIEEETDLR